MKKKSLILKWKITYTGAEFVKFWTKVIGRRILLIDNQAKFSFSYEDEQLIIEVTSPVYTHLYLREQILNSVNALLSNPWGDIYDTVAANSLAVLGEAAQKSVSCLAIFVLSDNGLTFEEFKAYVLLLDERAGVLDVPGRMVLVQSPKFEGKQIIREMHKNLPFWLEEQSELKPAVLDFNLKYEDDVPKGFDTVLAALLSGLFEDKAKINVWAEDNICYVTTISSVYCPAYLQKRVKRAFPLLSFPQKSETKIKEPFKDTPEACYIPLRMLDISTRLLNISHIADIKYVGDWACLDLDKPLGIRGFGDSCRREVKRLLKTFHLSDFKEHCQLNKALWRKGNGNMIIVEQEPLIEKLSKMHFPDKEAVREWISRFGDDE